MHVGVVRILRACFGSGVDLLARRPHAAQRVHAGLRPDVTVHAVARRSRAAGRIEAPELQPLPAAQTTAAVQPAAGHPERRLKLHVAGRDQALRNGLGAQLQHG
jgi:hypothetical protein